MNIKMRETRMTFPVTAPDWLRIQMRILLGKKVFPTSGESEYVKIFLKQPDVAADLSVYRDPPELQSAA